jgi:hypothetical protein
MKRDDVNSFIDTVIGYATTTDLKKLWHFYLFLLIFNTWLELFLFALYKPLNMNLSLLITFIIGLVPIYAFSIYCIKYHAINKRRPYWVLPFLAILTYIFFAPNPNPIEFSEAPALIKLYADNCIYLTFLTALRIMFVIRNKKK